MLYFQDLEKRDHAIKRLNPLVYVLVMHVFARDFASGDADSTNISVQNEKSVLREQRTVLKI